MIVYNEILYIKMRNDIERINVRSSLITASTPDSSSVRRGPTCRRLPEAVDSVPVIGSKPVSCCRENGR